MPPDMALVDKAESRQFAVADHSRNVEESTPLRRHSTVKRAHANIGELTTKSGEESPVHKDGSSQEHALVQWHFQVCKTDVDC